MKHAVHFPLRSDGHAARVCSRKWTGFAPSTPARARSFQIPALPTAACCPGLHRTRSPHFPETLARAQVFQSASGHSTLRDEASRPLLRWAGPAAAGRCCAAAGGLRGTSRGVSGRVDESLAIEGMRTAHCAAPLSFPCVHSAQMGTQLGFAGAGGAALLPATPCSRQILSNPCPAHCRLLCRTARLHRSRWQHCILERSCRDSHLVSERCQLCPCRCL